YQALDYALAHRLIPDPLLRAGSRAGARARERHEARGGPDATRLRIADLVAHKSRGPIAEATDAANAQHYELPADFLGLILGPRRKPSGCLGTQPTKTPAQAEEAMLELTESRAQIEDGQRILDLGCGWGSLSLWLAERYPNAQITAVSNSHRQRCHIEQE